ncbi:MAG: hypothetical protein ACXV2C_00275 [Candidatus Bathyarchaeia archaeon]
MTIAVANVANTNTFLFWQTITNQLASAMSTAVITTTANGTSAQTAGNAAISGTLSANIHLSNTTVANALMTVGNSTVNTSLTNTSLIIANSTVTLTIVAPTATQVSNGNFYLNANGQYALVSTITPLSNNTLTTTGTTTQNVDQWSISTFRSAEYMVSVFDNNANNHFSTKIHTTHDTASAWVTEYGQLTTNSSVGTFSATVISGNLVLQFTPSSTSTSVRFMRIVI